MRQSITARVPSRLSAVALFLACAAALAGCGRVSIDDIAPPALDRPAGAGPLDTGTYPNLNIAPKAAATPLTPEESSAKLARLRSAQAGQAPPSSGSSEAEKERLRLIGEGHGSDTLKVIEGN